MRVFTTTTAAAAQKLKLDYKKWATENNPQKTQKAAFWRLGRVWVPVREKTSRATQFMMMRGRGGGRGLC